MSTVSRAYCSVNREAHHIGRKLGGGDGVVAEQRDEQRRAAGGEYFQRAAEIEIAANQPETDQRGGCEADRHRGQHHQRGEGGERGEDQEQGHRSVPVDILTM
jgi:hypothetical protein